ncbi:Dnmt3b, partial [Symbiodinium microadriaticum]
MQSALEQLRDKETFIVQGRSRQHHVIAVPEKANPPTAWTTVCGWRYGLSQFYRAQHIGSSDRRRVELQQLELVLLRLQLKYRRERSLGDLDYVTWDYGDLGRQIASSFERAEVAAWYARDSAHWELDCVATRWAAPKQAGAGDTVRAYLKLSVGTLAMVARDEASYETTIIEPLLRGFSTDSGKLELPEVEQPIARAVLLYMWNLAREARAAASAPSPSSAPSGPPASSPTTTGASRTSDEKAPKTLPPKVWQEAVAKYNAVCVGGVPREFPIKKLVGAESVLARFHWEHVTSKAYSPLELGELISKRSFTATGGVNHLASRKRSTRLEFDGESLRSADETTWEPRSLWAVVDDLDAIRWCHILFEVGEERQINLFFDEMTRRARERPDKIEIFRECYAAVSWSICMAMRVNKTYKEASDAILADVTMWNEYMAHVDTVVSESTNRPAPAQVPWRPDVPAPQPEHHNVQSEPAATPSVAASASASTKAAAPANRLSAMLPLRGDSALPVPGLQNCGDVILLSFFDGIGSASLALESLRFKIQATMEWEIESSAIAVSSRVCGVVATMLQDLLRDKESLVLVTAGPPCPHYSRLSATSSGREGDSGQLFVRFAEFLQSVETRVQRKFHILIENVVLRKSTDLAWFNRALDAQPVVADASSFGMINRQLKWDKVDGLSRLQLGVSKDLPESFTMPGLSFHEDICSGKRRLPCLTTPAPSDEGRPAPKRMKGKLSASVKSKWLEGNRQYAPWMYENHALVYEANGSGQLLPAELKEQLHHYPSGFTRHEKVSPRDRHRLLGNSWHLGVARFMLALVLLHGFASAKPVAATGLESVMQEARAREIPVAGHVQPRDRVGVKPAFDMDEQWHNSSSVNHPVLEPPVLEEAVQKTMAAILQKGPDVSEYRKRTLDMLRVLRDQMQGETEVWYRNLAPHAVAIPIVKAGNPGPMIGMNILSARTMLSEILAEKDQGLVEGPFEAHSSWGFKAVGATADDASGLRGAIPALIALLGQVCHWTRAPVSTLTNGWGFLVRAGSYITAGHGDVPADIVAWATCKAASQYGAAILQGVPDGYWQLLRKVATSMTFATGDAVQEALQLEFSFGVSE